MTGLGNRALTESVVIFLYHDAEQMEDCIFRRLVLGIGDGRVLQEFITTARHQTGEKTHFLFSMYYGYKHQGKQYFFLDQNTMLGKLTSFS